ncbi:rolling circle replication-associated protein, partial [Nocardia mangyaensis]|uniref:rolling circle replication-associated protein n=1 Tax=Nocardia mangyaensis TaxID=2213200 RepID=UPI002675E29B
VEHFQKFLKRLRNSQPLKTIRFFHCGEYGDQGGRPHYHACIFNHDFTDKEHYKTVGDYPLYHSKELSRLWPYGFCTIGTLTFETAAYTARYITKKITGPEAEQHYNGRKPEYITMSRRPGIAKQWLNQYKSDVYPNDYVIVNGKKCGAPKFYDQQLSDDELLKIKSKRKYKAMEHTENNTLRRLVDRETVQLSRSTQLKRSYEND